MSTRAAAALDAGKPSLATSLIERGQLDFLERLERAERRGDREAMASAAGSLTQIFPWTPRDHPAHGALLRAIGRSGSSAKPADAMDRDPSRACRRARAAGAAGRAAAGLDRRRPDNPGVRSGFGRQPDPHGARPSDLAVRLPRAQVEVTGSGGLIAIVPEGRVERQAEGMRLRE